MGFKRYVFGTFQNRHKNGISRPCLTAKPLPATSQPAAPFPVGRSFGQNVILREHVSFETHRHGESQQIGFQSTFRDWPLIQLFVSLQLNLEIAFVTKRQVKTSMITETIKLRPVLADRLLSQ